MFGLFGLCLIAFDGYSNLIINTPGWASKDQHYFAFFLHILQHSISRNPLSASEHASGHTSLTLPWPLQWSHGRPLTSPWPHQAFLSPPLHISSLIFPLTQLGIPDALLCPNVTLSPSHILARPFFFLNTSVTYPLTSWSHLLNMSSRRPQFMTQILKVVTSFTQMCSLLITSQSLKYYIPCLLSCLFVLRKNLYKDENTVCVFYS